MKNWDDLKLLLAVQRGGGAGAAAQQLATSHATISRRIAALESELKVKLVDRSSHTWRITPIGERLAELAEDMETAVIEADRVAHSHSAEISGTVRITAGDMCFRKMVVPALRDFRHGYPEISLKLESTDAVVDLPRRNADIALRITDTPDPNLIGKRICSVGWQVYGTAELVAMVTAEMRGGKVSAPIVTSNSGADPLPDWAQPNFSDASPRNYASTLPLQSEMAQNGYGLVALPCLLGDGEAGLVRLEAIPRWNRYSVWVLANDDTRNSTRIRLVKTALIKGLEQMIPLIEGSNSGFEDKPRLDVAV